MKRHWLMPALSAASALLTLACGSDSGGTSNNPPPAGDVLVQNFRFNPTTFSVTAGSTVTWAWDSDGQAHTVTSNDAGSTFNSGQKSSGTFEHTFATAGTFAYHCEIHPSMVGTITVTAAAGDGGSSGGGGGMGGGGGGAGGGGGGYGYMRTTP
jgi:YD repeat-containing protein